MLQQQRQKAKKDQTADGVPVRRCRAAEASSQSVQIRVKVEGKPVANKLN